MALAADQVLNNRYRIKALLGRGNFGAVYYAWDLNLNSPVAVKELLSTTPEVTQQFTLEARMLANLRHPNLPYVIDHFSLSGSGQYLVMEFIEGENLQDLINRYGRGMSAAQVLPWIRQICEALSFLHSQSPAIIHRDIKPANIRITAVENTASEGKAVLVDFGITRSSDPVRRTTILTGGSEAAFIPPELQVGVADECSDIYSLGATLYAALTGSVPADVLKRQAGQALVGPRQYNPAVTQRTEVAILQALELAPERRFQSVEEFLKALGSPDAGGPIPPTQVVQGYAQPIPPTVQVKHVPAVVRHTATGYDLVSPPRRKESKSWIIWVIIILGMVCLLGGVVTGAGLYTIFYTTDTPTPTLLEVIQSLSPEDQAATKTAMVPQLTSSAPPTTAYVPDTLTPTPIPSWTSVLTLPPSLTFSPVSSTPSSTPSPSSTVSPVANPTWQPCPGAFPSRLHVGDRAFVGFDPPLANRVRAQPNASSTILGFLQPGEKMEIIGGPACSNQWVWWQVRSLEKSLKGWTAEGDNQSYWLIPLP